MLGASCVGGPGLQRVVGPDRCAIRFPEERIQRCVLPVSLGKAGRGGERDDTVIERDRKTVHCPQSLELEDLTAGSDSEAFGLVEGGRPDCGAENPRPGRGPSFRCQLGEAQECVRRLGEAGLVTNVPRPCTACTSPSASSAAIARLTVALLTPHSAQHCRSGGSWPPLRKLPDAIRAAMSS